VLLLAHDADGVIAGTVQVVLSQPDNQPHRADVAKMLVHRRARRQGLARSLMLAAEVTAHDHGKTLLVFDTVTGSVAAKLYENLGWKKCGDIPNYALMPTGEPCSTTYYYRAL
jgi:GNAT superfamily N-acetyltransferase